MLVTVLSCPPKKLTKISGPCHKTETVHTCSRATEETLFLLLGQTHFVGNSLECVPKHPIADALPNSAQHGRGRARGRAQQQQQHTQSRQNRTKNNAHTWVHFNCTMREEEQEAGMGRSLEERRPKQVRKSLHPRGRRNEKKKRRK